SPHPAPTVFYPLSLHDALPISVLFVEKSRDMMASWLFVGLFTHAAMTTPGIEVLFQSQKEEKAFELVDYAKILYEQQHELLRKRSEEHTSELQSRENLVCRLLL